MAIVYLYLARVSRGKERGRNISKGQVSATKVRHENPREKGTKIEEEEM